MPFDRPDLKTLRDRARADFERLTGAVPVRRSLAAVIADMHAGGTHGLYGYLDWLAKQIIPDTAETEFMERHASIWGIARKPATRAAGLAIFTGTDGSVIPSGTLLQRSDNAQYSTAEEGWIVSGQAAVLVQAQALGTAGNAAQGVKFSLVSPVAGVQSQATVAAGGLTGGADSESDNALRARLLARLRRTPQGGAEHDYEAWALAVPGVTRCWVSPREMGAGTVSVRIMMDEAYLDGIPQPADLQAVQDYIESLRPVTADVYVLAPSPLPVDISVRVVPDTPQVRAAVQTELADLFRREGVPGGEILLSHIREAISLAVGERDHVLLAPASHITPGPGELATLGAITWED
ncbi:baseplate J/gp47 family protein [Desulfocurvibacter africanus]|uniref:Baseplate J family protein n=1 Tax=Desulfocurvibacter africanus subsp. africanus str. Walvis Bay TaxID=690850 RepID=F3YW28_DESAF|nr:baseplate J/gp47 family protein [Desulfocurvibacter africanus]EGJ49058.1 Baseplate J family protein [Desulfocurvibacter africanus subsp. africanus str. Walvis Bay]